VPAEVDRDVEDFSAETANELSLRLLNLVMETTHHVPPGKGLIVLNEAAGDAEFCQNPFIVAFEKRPAVIFENVGFNDLDVCNRGRNCLHQFTLQSLLQASLCGRQLGTASPYDESH
jgi:hypothetical protein